MPGQLIRQQKVVVCVAAVLYAIAGLLFLLKGWSIAVSCGLILAVLFTVIASKLNERRTGISVTDLVKNYEQRLPPALIQRRQRAKRFAVMLAAAGVIWCIVTLPLLRYFPDGGAAVYQLVLISFFAGSVVCLVYEWLLLVLGNRTR